MLTALGRYPEILLQAAAQRAPHALVHFLRELAQRFHTWYNAAQFLVEESDDAQRPAGSGAGRAAGHAQRADAAGEFIDQAKILMNKRDRHGVGIGMDLMSAHENLARVGLVKSR